SPKEDTESLIGAVTRKLSLSGPAVALSAACASGNHALALARCWLEMGWADICLAGACFMGVNRLSLAGLGHLRAVSRRNSESHRRPSTTSTRMPRLPPWEMSAKLACSKLSSETRYATCQ